MAGTGERGAAGNAVDVYVVLRGAGCPQVMGPLFGLTGQDGQERMGEHGQGDVPVPGVVAAYLVIAEPGLALACNAIDLRALEPWPHPDLGCCAWQPLRLQRVLSWF